IGYGAGTRDGKTRPNVLRLILGNSGTADETDQVMILETNLDDTTGQEIGHACEMLFAAGALDVFTTPIHMKKNRPGVLLTVLAAAHLVERCEDVLFAQTRTLGVRKHLCARVKLARRSEKVSTPFGDIRVKIGARQGHDLIVSPEYDDCAA